MYYNITNNKTGEHFIKYFSGDSELSVKNWVINTLDLSLQWNINIVDLNNKGDIIKFIIYFNDDIKEIDSAIPLNISKILKDITPLDNMVTCYYRDSSVKIINIIEILHFTLKRIKGAL